MDIRNRKLRGVVVLSLLIILCLFTTIILNTFSYERRVVAVSTGAPTTNIGDLLFSNYADRPDKKFFDGEQLDKLYAQITGKENATYNDVVDAAKKIKTSADFRSTSNIQTGGKLITFTILDMVWNAMYLSTNKLGEPILSVWLASSSDTSKWNSYASSSCGTYPGNMYGSSYLRTETLNNTGKYFSDIDGNGETNYTQKSSGHKYAKFTSPSADGSLTDFIDEPAKVAWQETERSTAVNAYIDDFNNDAYGEVTGAHWNSNIINYYDLPSDDAKMQYVAWKNDKIWIPSIAEVGWSDSGKIQGIWKTSTLERGNSAGITSWTRSAVNNRYIGIQTLIANGSTTSENDSSYSGNAVRPAFHLNLAKVNAASAKPLTLPQDVELEYNGNEQGVESKYSQDFLDSVDIAYYDEGSSTPRTKPTAVGNYTVKYTLKDGYYWSDNLGGAERIKKFTITQRKLDFPKFDNSQYSIQKQYAGDEEISFTLGNYDKNFIEVTYSGGDSGVSYDSTYSEALAKYVGKYYLDVKIKDEYGSNCVFKDKPTNSKLEFEIIKKEVETEILDGSSSNIVGIRGSKKKVTLNMPDAQKKVHSGKKIYVQIIAKDKYNEFELSGNIEITGDKLQYNEIELNIGRLRKGSYDLDAKVVDGLNGASYSVSVVNGAKLEVKEVEPGSQLIWQMYSGSDTDGSFVGANIGDIESEYDSFAYDGKEYHFEVTPPTGYTVESIKTTNTAGDEVEYGKNADTYITTVELKETANNEITEYRITWTIDKAKYDLSGVKWEYPDGKLPYTQGGINAVLDERTLPEGLKAKYSNSTIKGLTVGQTGTEIVTFELESDYAGNYVLPKEDDKESYDGEFSAWRINWEVVKATIETVWKTEIKEDKNGVKYTVWELDMGKYPSNIITYRYYEVNSVSEITPETPYVTEIVVEDKKVKTYIAQAVFSSDNGDKYELKGEIYSNPFGVGSYAEEVEIDLKSKEMFYNGKSQEVNIQVKKGEISLDLLEAEYYDKDGTTALVEAPTKVGKYRVEIRIKEGIEGYYLSGENVLDGVAIIEYEIKQMEVKNDVWNTKHNPPSLSVSASEIKGIKHEYRDIDGNVLEFKDLKPGNKYEVRAVITDKTNYIFADGSTETEWVEFEVKENEEIFDPDDPNNPYYPSDDGSTPDDTDKDGGALEEILAKIKDLPLWQLIASGISIILTIAFLSKTASNESKRKKAKKVMEKKYNTFYATAFLGISVTNWTVIASVLMGSAVLSLIFMVISQKRRNKAEEELEDAKEEYNKMMLMRMMGGNVGNMQNGMGAQGFAYAPQQGLGAEEIRGIVSETMTAMLPNVQQYLPQQASVNDERIDQLMKANEDLMRNQEMLMRKLSEQQPIERVIEKDGVSEETLEKLISKLTAQQTVEKVMERDVVSGNQVVEKVIQVSANDEKINMLMQNQEMLLKKIEELSAKSTEKEVIEKIVEVPVEKIVEKEVVKEVPVEVEKIVEKEVKVEVPIEVEKVVEKIVEIPATKPAPKAKTAAPRLTLDEAYSKLSAKQKKFFDTLKEYAMSKDKCKEKKSTYYILLGQSSVNPLVKLTIKKDCTVALFKMEDEYMKDIRRNAGSEGTKVKVKETELIVGDSQALATAKEMIDLREDQIERYNDFLKEQRSMRKS